AFTQPIMYDLIRKHPTVTKIYRERLLEGGVISESEIEQMKQEIEDILERAQVEAKELQVKFNQTGFKKVWTGMQRNFSFDPVDTAAPEEMLKMIATKLAELPEGFTPHGKLVRLMETRRKLVHEGKPMDWGTVEALAYGSLLVEGTPVRLTGQDSQRGTFSHRHAVLTDINTEEEYTPLDHINGDQARFCIYDSPLAEASVVGFEYGYSLGDPKMLVMWEAQFGDFVNGAQVIIDQFIASAQAKWDRHSGLVLLLPHGYEGQGPEHSSARVERFLQLCAEENIQVANPTTPAQYFHMIRRQMKRSFRKPLIVLTPKSLLRHPKATSVISDLTTGCFNEILDDAEVSSRDAVTRVLLCSGKVYYDLAKQREEAERTDTAIIRVEQLYPLHTDLIQEILGRYPNVGADSLLWVQEEPKNMGAWMHMSHWFDSRLNIRLKYVGRPESPTPAVGSKAIHDRELIDLLLGAFPPIPVGANR
ncbi:MAG: 2-oxoglutarate dehydrogenase E1 component, partial [Candidatus Sumerlaeia bacterium]|nr:2-oxoglutarate dehydrogenase E1 component [Candidatus Sumerlaeia bacterium]